MVRNNLEDVITAIDLSRKTFSQIRWNYFFAMAYNIVAIPVAAGALFPRSPASKCHLGWPALAWPSHQLV
ncbi:hypothetical protein GUJ93_ZPchr0006g42101 [Zizania palustris]|uniref:Uncharacterized protein n=1 Tax=Zizania palustris TaxID=103762 RepID=A0A8J5TAI6_ZIZPA|nr:hypothetical protein GUJ93_ZPchr0006g42101 [Zizania palustris]